MNLHDVRISWQLSAAFGFFICLMVVFNIVGGHMVGQNKQRLAQQSGWVSERMDAVAVLKTAILYRLTGAQHGVDNSTSGNYPPYLPGATQGLANLQFTDREAGLVAALLDGCRQLQHEPIGSGNGPRRDNLPLVTGTNETVVLQGIVTSAEKLEKALSSQARLSLADASLADERVRKVLTTINVVALTLVVMVAYRITRGIVAPLRHAVTIADMVASGDLTARIDSVGKNEIGILICTLGRMSTNLAHLVQRVRHGADSSLVIAQESSGTIDRSPPGRKPKPVR